MEYKSWLKDLRDFWIHKDIPNIVQLFTQDVEYYETPFEKVDNISEVWKDIEDHIIDKLSYNIIGIKDNCIIANYILELPTRTVDMVYEIHLDDNNKCYYFKQWFMSNK